MVATNRYIVECGGIRVLALSTNTKYVYIGGVTMGSSMFDLQYFTFNLLLLYVCLPWYDPDNWMTVDMMSLFLLFTIISMARQENYSLRPIF